MEAYKLPNRPGIDVRQLQGFPVGPAVRRIGRAAAGAIHRLGGRSRHGDDPGRPPSLLLDPERPEPSFPPSRALHAGEHFFWCGKAPGLCGDTGQAGNRTKNDRVAGIFPGDDAPAAAGANFSGPDAPDKKQHSSLMRRLVHCANRPLATKSEL